MKSKIVVDKMPSATKAPPGHVTWTLDLDSPAALKNTGVTQDYWSRAPQTMARADTVA